MKVFANFQKIEKRLIVGSLVCLLLTSLVFLFGEDLFLGDESLLQKNPEIGRVIRKERDIRIKSTQISSWNKARENQSVHNGDSIFSGEKSNLQIELKDGGRVDIGENSMLVFKTVERERVADIRQGKFQLKVNGTIKIAIQGRLTQISGKNSEVQVTTGKDNKPELVLLKGEASVRLKGQEDVVLNTETQFVMPEPEMPEPTPQSSAEIVDTDQPIPMPVKSNYSYIWQIRDLFEQNGANLRPRSEQVLQVELPIQLSWSLQKNAKVKVELSGRSDFMYQSSFESEMDQFELREVFVGDNYWRISKDGLHWSNSEKFHVSAGFLKSADPIVKWSATELPLVDGNAAIKGKLSAAIRPVSFIVQSSQDEKFPLEKSTVFRVRSDAITLTFDKVGTYYYRFMAVNSAQEVSAWSKPTRISIFTAEPQAPTILTEVKPPAEPAFAKIWQGDGIQREMAAVESSSSMKKAEIESGLRNESFKSSQLSLAGFMSTQYSSAQYYAGQSKPVVSGLTLHGMYWSGRHGFEASLKTGVLGFNSAGQEQSSMKDLEARYHYRFFADLPFTWSQELQISVFGGYEVYRATGSYFSNQYDLFKVGTAMDFPVSTNWMLGGEFVFGLGTDNSQKKEISGHAYYFFDPKWSFGAGYRVYIFDAGSASASPQGSIPYKEGSTEGFSILNYHY